MTVDCSVCWVQDIEAELNEVVGMRAEAQHLGDPEVIAELVADEERLQVWPPW